MADDPRASLAYHAGLLRLRDLDVLPEAWACTRCSAITRGEDILISYVGDTPIPYCPTEGCPGRGEDLELAEA
jgi:hypothetical protein